MDALRNSYTTMSQHSCYSTSRVVNIIPVDTPRRFIAISQDFNGRWNLRSSLFDLQRRVRVESIHCMACSRVVQSSKEFKFANCNLVVGCSKLASPARRLNEDKTALPESRTTSRLRLSHFSHLVGYLKLHWLCEALCARILKTRITFTREYSCTKFSIYKK